MQAVMQARSHGDKGGGDLVHSCAFYPWWCKRDPSSYTEKEHMIEKLNAVGISCIMHTTYKIQTAADEMYIQVFYVFREVLLYLISLSNALSINEWMEEDWRAVEVESKKK